MKSLTNLKKPFGTAKMVRIRSVRYLAWEDAFDVEFDDGLSFLESHKAIRKANRISPKTEPVKVVHWERGEAKAEIVSPISRKLKMAKRSDAPLKSCSLNQKQNIPLRFKRAIRMVPCVGLKPQLQICLTRQTCRQSL